MLTKRVKMANQQVNTRQSAEECANPSGNTTFPPDINRILDREYFEIVAVVKISNLLLFFRSRNRSHEHSSGNQPSNRIRDCNRGGN